MTRRLALLCTAILISTVIFSKNELQDANAPADSLSRAIAENQLKFPIDTIISLTDQDFEEVADSLGVEVAAIKAVVDIEAGRAHEGFYAPGKPLINFDLPLFRRFASKRGVNVSTYSKSHPIVFTSSKGSQKTAHRRLDAAKSINTNAAYEGTFWGMFQIGGFNWKRCGAESINDFVEKMSRSERDQLDLFANFITNTGLVKHLKNKNWAAFARGYNGPSYARRNYHTRMASAYNRHTKLLAEKNSES
ncbi:MAG: N-acetylmuramidase family protein [Duncaniella sp.]|nr:N-acetylmuramidase family protein [Muribaculum sp.]MCM1254554.1 N-acetylmuramidase family protein [Duncaniella sp.]